MALKVVESNPEAALAKRATDAEERELLARVAEKRDQAAFRSLYGAYFQRLSRLLTRMSMRPQDVEEVINDTFWVVWTKAGDFRGGSLLSTWIIGIAYRRALNTLRRERIRPVSDQEIDENMASVPSTAQDVEYAQWVGYGLEKLPVEQRLALELTYTLGHSCEEVAAILNCPVNTVKTRLFRARETLKQVLPALGGMTGDAR